jgi:hypothetical protein
VSLATKESKALPMTVHAFNRLVTKWHGSGIAHTAAMIRADPISTGTSGDEGWLVDGRDC